MGTISISKVCWHALLYKWFYKTYVLPTSLCVYFWQFIIAIIFAIPLFLLTLPTYIIVILFRREKYDPAGSYLLAHIIIGLAVYTAIVCLFLSFSLLHALNSGKKPIFRDIAGATVIIIATGGTIGFYISDNIRLHKKRKREAFRNAAREMFDKRLLTFEQYQRMLYYNPKRVTRISLLFLAIRAWYQKSCPFINWKP